MNEALVRSAREALENAQRILVTSHIHPDGDAVGSVLGLGLALQEADKQAQMVLTDGVPATFKHLPGANHVRRRPSGKVDLAIVLDCSSLERVGGALEEYGQPDINIDHHVTNLNFARINLVDTEAVAVAEILAGNMDAFGLPLTQAVGTALLTSIITDTLGFRTQNMTSKALRIAADLVDLDINISDLYFRVLTQRSYKALQYWGTGLSRLQRDGKMIWASLTLEDRQDVGYPGRDDADLVNVISSINDSDVTLIFVEQPHHKVKVSWRARSGFDTSQIALRFGGGGHTGASGAEVEGTLEEVQSKILEATRTLLDGKQPSVAQPPVA